VSADIVTVKLWGDTIGYLGYEPGQSEIATLQYTTAVIQKAIEPSPLKVPLNSSPYTFNEISTRTFHGLVGFIADALPDKFGEQLIDQYFGAKGIASKDITALDRLLYIGNRSMGALSFEPSEQFHTDENIELDLQSLSELAELVLTKKEAFARELTDAKQEQALKLLKIGSSAGGARSKALVAIDNNKKLFDGTVEHPFTCSYWLLKFDSSNNSDKEKQDPKGMTKIEYIYSLLANACNIAIPSTDYIEDGDDFHFLIERFDRMYVDNEGVQKLHYVSWCGMTHSDRDTTGSYSYEQLVLTARELMLGQDAIEEIFRRALFNIVGRNQDDHTKNFGFLMDKNGTWALSPAFDMTYSYDPTGKWTRVHQIKLHGKQDDFTREDFFVFGTLCNLSKKSVIEILERTINAFETFDELAVVYGVEIELKETIMQNLRLSL